MQRGRRQRREYAECESLELCGGGFARAGGERAGTAAFSATLPEHGAIRELRAAYFFTGTTPVDVPGWIAGRLIGAIVIGGGTALNG